MKKDLRIVNDVKISKSKRFIAAVMLFSYVSVLNPFFAFANTGKQEITECKEVLISAQEGGKIELDGASIEIPSGALKKDTKISITHLRRVEDTGESLFNAIPSSGGYRFLPHGTKFLKDVTITLPYSPELNGKPQALEDLFTYFYDEKNHQWIKLERLEVDQKECVVRSLSNHFTDMINATLTLPESASPVDVNLNSIKNLEAAKPDGHLIKFNSPKASNMGDASFSFELAVPAGRRGMEPAISVSYSSAGGNGIMGKGFDVTYGSSVTIDTRLGLPEYDSQEYTGNTEEIRFGLQNIKVNPVKYMLDGVLLYEKVDERSETYASYMQQKEGAFSRIEHFFGDKNYWLVTDKSGTKRYYGQTEASCVGSGNETYTWNLTKVVDVHGNTVTYKYKDKDDSGYSYPEQIQYTGFEGKNAEAEDGSYYVNFYYDEKPADAAAAESWPRADVRIDARSKKIVACKKLLTSITTCYKGNAPIRKYTFKYNEGLAKEKQLMELTVWNNAMDDSYSYTFDYNPVEKIKDGDNEYIKYFDDAVVWNNGAAIKTGKSGSLGGNFTTSAGVGVGDLPGFADVRVTGGLSGSFSNSTSESESLFVDINADGSPDYVRIDSDNQKLIYRLNKNNEFCEDEESVSLGEYFVLDDESSKEYTIGGNLYGGGGLNYPITPGLGVSYSNVTQNSESTTVTGLNDIDRDGRVDIILSGNNYYLKNTYDIETGKIKFIKTYYDSENSQVIKNSKKEYTDIEIENFKKTYRIQTPFRQWKAEHSGTLKISASLKKGNKFKDGNKVKAYIYANPNDNIETNNDKLIELTFSNPTDNATIDISEGESLYFITETDEPLNSDVEFNVSLEYTAVKVFHSKLPKPVFDSDYKTDNPSDLERFSVQKNYNEEVAKKNFFPGAFTEEQFKTIIYNHSKDESEKDFYEELSNCYLHDLVSRMYILRDEGNRDPEDEDFEKVKPVINSEFKDNVIHDSWNNYSLYGLKSFFDGEKVTAVQQENADNLSLERKYENTGSVLDNGNILILGRIDGQLLKLNLETNKLYSGDNLVENLEAEISREDESILVMIKKHNDSDNHNDHDRLIYNFNNPTKKAFNITAGEMNQIVSDYNFDEKEQIDYWLGLDDISEEDLEKSFSELYKITDEEKDDLCSKLYNYNSDTEKYDLKKEISDYTIRQVTKLLEHIKFIRVTEQVFPYYVLSESNEYYEYLLKDEYKAEDKNPEDLINECDKYGLKKYCSAVTYFEYDDEKSYTINNGKISCHKIIKNSVDVETSTIDAEKVKWDSKDSWNKLSVLEDEPVIFSYESTKKTDNEEIKVTSNIQIERLQKLTPGAANWFFGIWVDGITEFSFNTIEELLTKKNIDTDKYKDRKEKSDDEISGYKELANDKEDDKENNNSMESFKTSAGNKSEEQPFYVPLVNKKQYEGDDNYPVKKEATATEFDDLENYPIGQVSIYSSKGTIEYYFPFIKGDYIHAGRAGGNTYYQITGFGNEETAQSSFMFPNIRQAETSGLDETFGVNLDLGIGAKDGFEFLSSLGENSFSAGFGGTYGWNKNDGKTTQSVMDINGDSVPDVVKQNGNNIYVIPGKIQNGKISYGSGYSINNVVLNTSHSDITVKGGSFSSGGAVKIKHSKNGVPTGAETNANVSGGAGSTKTEGNSYINNGLIDINGDGLPDYFDGSTIYYNTGRSETDSFKSTAFSNTFKGTMSTSNMNSLSANLNIGKAASHGESLTCGVNVGTGLSYSVSSNKTSEMFTDINGDGLADRLINSNNSIQVRYNTGAGFTEPEHISLPTWESSKNISETALGKLTTQKEVDFSLGVINQTPVIGNLISDGLNTLSIYNPYGTSDIDNLEYSSSITLGLSGNIGVSFTFPCKIPIAGISVNITCSGGNGLSGSSGINYVNVSLMDLDGDGLPDHVLRIPGEATYWKRNISGKYGLLNKINLPQGGNIELEYTEMYGTVKNPNFKYVMSKVTVNDGCGETVPKIDHEKHSLVTEYKYEDGYYDRAKKDFYGFGKVTATFADGSKQVDEYNNSDYYLKGTLSSSSLFDENGNILSENSTKYCDEPFALTESETSVQYEAASGDNFIRTSTSYEYDNYGNCTYISQNFGNGEKLYANIEYENRDSSNKYLVGLPVDISVYGSDNSLLRHRGGSYNEYGQLTSLKQYFTSNDYSENTITYDAYGNIASVKDSRDATLSYEYDGKVHTFVRTIRQKGSGTEEYVSEIETEVTTQTKKSETDCNGNKLNYRYDKWQRLVKVWDSCSSETNPAVTYSTEENPAVSYEYNNSLKNSDGTHNLWYTVTNNKVSFDSDDEQVIQTVVQIDGLGRTVRTAKTGFVAVNGAKTGTLGWNVSGAVIYNQKGLAIAEGMTEFIEGNLDALLETSPAMTNLNTKYVYDAKDRKIKTTLPDGAIQENRFFVEDNKLVSETVDPLGNISVQEADSRGNIVRVARKDKDEKLLTEVTYKYNEMGEMLKALDAKGNPISAEYDMLGRRTALESLDGGRKEFFYDKCSNLIRETDSVMRDKLKQIRYEYDGLNRLVKIDYPDTKDTVYTYGGVSDKNVGAAGKILKVEDASGTLEYEYGKLGEVTKEKRTLSTHLNGENPTVTAEMKYRSDYLGRMQSITYPDGEELTYAYDDGGQVVSVTGKHYGSEFNYVTNILYDEYGQRTRIEYGNGTHTEYSYDPARRWLSAIKTQNRSGVPFQNMSYEFDLVGNVKGYENDCLDGGRGNYKTSQNYEYDALYQLTRAYGETTHDPYKSLVPDFKSAYEQVFEFDGDGLGNMMKKVSSETVTPRKTIGDNLNYTFDYEYDENYAHRLIHAGNLYYQYDANGNVTCEQDGSFESNGDDVKYHKISEEADNVYSTDYGWGLFRDSDSAKTSSRYRRTYTWNERNQLICSKDASYTTNYIYGQDGQRTNKYTARSETLYFNKMWTMHTDSGNSVYGGQNAKNIYLGDTRIVTKLASPRENTIHEEYYKQYYYHSDHLGSASLISDYKGDEYQRIEYTPYGETWVEKTQNTGLEYLPYKFTGQMKDEETGNYYIGARYLQPQTCRWLSCDPAVGEYLSKTSEGEGGIYNSVNLNLYHYAGNSPINYKDEDGRIINFVIGASVGAVFGAAFGASCEVFNQVVIEGKGLDNIDMGKVGIAAAGGALSGALAGSGVGLAGQIVGNAVISAAQNTSNQVRDIHNGEQNEFNAKSLIVDTAFGAVAGGAGGSGNGTNKVIKNASKQLTNKISKEIKHKGLIGGLSSNTSKKAWNYFCKNIKSSVNQITDVADSVILTNTQNTLNAIGEYIEKKQSGDCNE